MSLLNKFLVFVICSLVICHCSVAVAKEYDGVWFLGFNLHKDVFADAAVRKAVGQAINRKYIVQKIISDEVVPLSVIPPNMAGYDDSLPAQKFDPKKAKVLLGKRKIKGLVLLHTDGVKTIAIAKRIKKDLADIGIDISLKEVPYADQEGWDRELASGRHHLFFMGYKAKDAYDELLGTVPTKEFDAEEILRPLFHSKGEANFTYFSNPRVDALLNELAGINMALKAEREKKLKEINRIIYGEYPTINLFYITKL